MSDEFMSMNIRYMQAWNDGDLDAVDETCSPDYISRTVSFPDEVGVEAHRDFIAAFRQALPDLCMVPDGVIFSDEAEGYQCLRWTMTGVHTGQSAVIPVPPTGKEVRISGCSIDRIVDGLYVETWTYPDNLGLLQQLGVIPPMG
jgi:steroid delta-isomerase-like uncharacterized protein